jgi:hypothetical protein
MPLLLACSLQPALNRGQGLRGVDEGDHTQGEAVRQKAGEEVGALLPVLLHGRNEAPRHRRLPLGFFQEYEVIGLAQFHLEGQDLGPWPSCRR